jgi:hypothetical protein
MNYCPDQSSAIPVTTSRLVEILRLPTSEAEAELFNRMRFLDRTEKLSYAEKGFISKAVHDFLLNEEHLDPDTGKPCSFAKWVRLACPWSYSTAHAAKRHIEALADIAPEHLLGMPPSAFPLMETLSTAVRSQPVIIEAAKESAERLVETVKRDFPEQHIQSKRVFRFRVNEDEAADVDAAITWATEHGIAGGPSEALHRMAVTALEEWKIEAELEVLAERGDANDSAQEGALQDVSQESVSDGG